jgi:hypothetical protein
LIALSPESARGKTSAEGKISVCSFYNGFCYFSLTSLTASA